MKFQRIKDMICGALIASMVLCSGTVAFAKVANMSIPVMYNNIKIMVNGEKLSTSKEPFIYDGTTYLPVRAVAEAVGMDVKWDGVTQTVTLSGGAATTTEKEEDTGLFGTSEKKKASVKGAAVKITCTDVRENRSYGGGFEMDFSFENTSSMHYTVTFDEFKVNGKTIDAFVYADCLDDRTTYETVSVWEKELKEAGITKVEEISMVFEVSNYDDWQDDTLTREMVLEF